MTSGVVLGRFVSSSPVPAGAFSIAKDAFLDTAAVTLAGSLEAAARAVQEVAAAESRGDACQILGTTQRAGATWAALANGTAAHALDYDDVSLVSLMHPSSPLVSAAVAAGELVHASGERLLTAYVVGFEIASLLAGLLNPSHYRRGWHCTSTAGTIGAAAAAARLLSLDADGAARALSIAASEASGLKENFGTMTKALHAGLAARNGVLAALLARAGLTASTAALDGPQGFLVAMDAEHRDLWTAAEGLGSRWEILEAMPAVKRYPSCAATHSTLDAVLEVRRRERISAADVVSIDVAVDPMTPTVLIHDRPRTGLEAKFSMQFCVAAAVAHGRIDLDTFETRTLADEGIRRVLSCTSVRVDPALGRDALPLTEALVTFRLRDGRTVRAAASEAHASHEGRAAALESKFRACAARALSSGSVESALERLRSLESVPDIRMLTAGLAGVPAGAASR